RGIGGGERRRRRPPGRALQQPVRRDQREVELADARRAREQPSVPEPSGRECAFEASERSFEPRAEPRRERLETGALYHGGPPRKAFTNAASRARIASCTASSGCAASTMTTRCGSCAARSR